MDTRSESLPPRPEALLSQSDWVRSLVRGLGVDENGAEDVLQSTWLAAITRPPRTDGEGASLRAWVARVARNFALRRLDRDRRRETRERAGAKEERLPSASDVVEREEARAQVVRALLDVSEPYRTTLLLRFYENLEPQDIARIQGVPGSTVRNRLKRGLELLGERLERKLGPTWRQRCVLVLPLVRAIPSAPGGSSSPADGSGGTTKWIPKNGTTGGGLVVEKIGLAAAALLATGGLVLTWTWSHSESESAASGESSISSELVADGGAESSGVPASNLDSELAPVEERNARERAPSTADLGSVGGSDSRHSLSGRLLGPDGQPITTQAQLLSYRLALGEALSIETAGPSAPIGVAFTGAVEDSMTVELGLGAPEISPAEPGPSAPREFVSLGLVEQTEGVLYERVRVVGQDLFDLSGGFADSSPHPRLVLSNAAGNAYEASTDGEGVFRFDELRPGRWQLFAEAPGCQSKRMEIEIASADRDKRLDVALDAVIRLRVKVVAPDGKDLRETILADQGHGSLFQPVPFARRTRPGDRTRDLSEDPARRYGSGSWQNRSDFPDEALGDSSGILEIHDRLPLFVGVSASGIVLETRMVHSGEEEVVFVIDPHKIRALAATVAFRAVSAEDGQPLHDAVASIEGLGEIESAASGSFEARDVPPGRRLLVVESPAHGRWEEWVDVLPGTRADLGARTLGRPVEITGRVVDEHGSPLSMNLDLFSLDRFVLGHRPPFEGTADSAEDGTFRFSDIPAGLHLLCVENVADPIAVDTRGGKVKDVVVRTSLRHEVRVMFPVEPPPDANYLVELADGTPIQSSPCEGWTPLGLQLGVGSYRARLVDGAETLWTRWILVNPDGAVVSDGPLEEER